MRYRLLIIAATIIWGSSFVIVKDVTNSMPPAWILVVRFTAAAIIMAVAFLKYRELYFERHQGTFTSIARQKMWNLTLEKDLHLLEYVSALADAAGVLSYPSAFLKEAWEDVMLFQFHDCLPGSAIVKVYEETQARYAELHAEAEKRIRLALSALLPPDAAEDAVLAVNPAPFASRLSGTGGEMLPPYGLRLFPCAPAEGPARPLKEPLLENERLRLVFTERGTISSLYDKSAGRELLPEGAEGNRLMLYPDGMHGYRGYQGRHSSGADRDFWLKYLKGE